MVLGKVLKLTAAYLVQATATILVGMVLIRLIIQLP